MKPEQERVRALLTDTVTLLCKNGLNYQKELRVQGLLGITLDDSDVFVVHINEKFGDLLGGAISGLSMDTADTEKAMRTLAADAGSAGNGSESEADGAPMAMKSRVIKKKKRRRRSTENATPVPVPPEESFPVTASPAIETKPNAAASNSSWSDDRTFQANTSNTTVAEMPVKLEIDDDDVVIIDDKSTIPPFDPSASVTNIVQNTAYPGAGGSLGEIQGNYQDFDQMLGGLQAAGSGEPASKRHATQDAYNDATAMPYITSMMRNDAQNSANSTWDESGYTAAGHGEGCSTWDPTAQGIAGAEQTSQSICTEGQSARSESTIVCDFPGCGRMFSCMRYMRAHRMRLHGVQLRHRRASNSGERRHKCDAPGCDKVYFELSSLNLHGRLKH